MIVLDIETSGLYPDRHGILEIGALKFESPGGCYQRLCRLDDFDEINDKALEINGQSREDVRDKNRMTQKEALTDFFDWVRGLGDFYAAGENIGRFDLNFIEVRANKYGLKSPFYYRSYDLHSAACLRYEQAFGELPVENGKPKLGLSQILEFVGLKDERDTHNALEDCRLEAEAISRIRFGRGLFSDYSRFAVPDYLKSKSG